MRMKEVHSEFWSEAPLTKSKFQQISSKKNLVRGEGIDEKTIIKWPGQPLERALFLFAKSTIYVPS